MNKLEHVQGVTDVPTLAEGSVYGKVYKLAGWLSSGQGVPK